MKKQFLSTIIATIVLAFLLGTLQAQTVTLTFTGKDANNNWVQLNRVSITNLTKGWQETIYWPDTTLTMQNGTGIDESVANGGFALSQNNPNPFTVTTDVNLTVTDAGAVTLEIVDGNGRIVGANNYSPLPMGTHQFRVSLSAAGTYVMTARQNGKMSSIKMVCNGAGNGNGIEYIGMVPTITYVLKSTTNNPFTFGDQMEYVGYATINGTEYESARISQMQGASQTFGLEFDLYADGLPMVSTLSVSNLTASSAEVSGIVLSDGGSIVTERGFCWDTLPQPTLSNASLQCGAGIGNFIGVISGLMAETTYYVRAYATNGDGTSYGAAFSFTTPEQTNGNGGSGGEGGSNHTYVEWDGEGLNPNDSYPCEGTPTLTDIDGNVYNTVQIGNQCWMKENLRTTRYADSTEISSGIYSPGLYPGSVTVYGYLYDWTTVMHGASSSSANPSGVQGICPTGWHVPSEAEWLQLTDYVGSQSEYICGGTNGNIGKSLAHEMGWSVNTNNTAPCNIGVATWGNNNATGFSALPAGYYYQQSIASLGHDACFYCATIINQDNEGDLVRVFTLHTNYNSVASDVFRVYDGFSVRCIRD